MAISTPTYPSTSASTSTPPSTHTIPSHQTSDNPPDISSILSNYSKSMHEHTRKQMEAAHRAAHRNNENADTETDVVINVDGLACGGIAHAPLEFRRHRSFTRSSATTVTQARH
ncbi:hypothetical protein SBOR_5286 [Sclerotinia borealis F-4128]|uniref:Uncharacterized protein n=1 Tax=Sclerotinia borealis (strain F-4128) TaxID=1432307 RepID=W9CC77_SCLBF|nr:hypothetical protein SBOR_5286 [Sclerotinia borealis F-4128]